MLPLVSNDAVAILFMFDLTRKATLNSVKEWYRQARGFNKVSEERRRLFSSQRYQTAIPVLIGTKYDQFASFPREEQEEITKQAKRFSKAMHAPLVNRVFPALRIVRLLHEIFCSTSHSINVQKIFKIVLAKAFDLKVSPLLGTWLIDEVRDTGDR